MKTVDLNLPFDGPAVPMSASDQAWFEAFKIDFEIYRKAVANGPYDLNKFLKRYDSQFTKEQSSKWNAKLNLVRYYCPVEIFIPRFERQFFNGKFYDERIKLLIEESDDNDTFVYAIEMDKDGDYRLYISNIAMAATLRLSYGYHVIVHKSDNLILPR